MSLSFSSRVIVSPDVIVRIVGEESVLLSLKTESYLGLDVVGTRFWSVLTGSQSLQQAYETLLTEYDVADGQLREDLEEFVQKLLEHSLIEVKALDAAAGDQHL